MHLAFVLNSALGWPACFQVTAGCPSQSLSPEALGKSLRIFRLGKAEHHEVAVIAAQGVPERRRRQDTGSAKFVHRQCCVVRPFALEIGASAFALAYRKCFCPCVWRWSERLSPTILPPAAAHRNWRELALRWFKWVAA
jgi:hypothetical protein